MDGISFFRKILHIIDNLKRRGDLHSKCIRSYTKSTSAQLIEAFHQISPSFRNCLPILHAHVTISYYNYFSDETKSSELLHSKYYRVYRAYTQ